jgi:hypothetical protein
MTASPALAQGPIGTPVPVSEADRKAAEDAARAQAAAVAAQAANAAYQNAVAMAEASKAAADQARAYANALDANSAASEARKASDLAGQAVASAQVVLNSVQGFNATIQDQQAEIRRLNNSINELTAVITLQRARMDALASDNASKAEEVAAESRRADENQKRPIIETPVAFMALVVLLLALAGFFFSRSRQEQL